MFTSTSSGSAVLFGVDQKIARLVASPVEPDFAAVPFQGSL
jgi:hypothetical protein